MIAGRKYRQERFAGQPLLVGALHYVRVSKTYLILRFLALCNEGTKR